MHIGKCYKFGLLLIFLIFFLIWRAVLQHSIKCERMVSEALLVTFD